MCIGLKKCACFLEMWLISKESLTVTYYFVSSSLILYAIDRRLCSGAVESRIMYRVTAPAPTAPSLNLDV
jgi:hypothetical protein